MHFAFCIVNVYKFKNFNYKAIDLPQLWNIKSIVLSVLSCGHQAHVSPRFALCCTNKMKNQKLDFQKNIFFCSENLIKLIAALWCTHYNLVFNSCDDLFELNYLCNNFRWRGKTLLFDTLRVHHALTGDLKFCFMKLLIHHGIKCIYCTKADQPHHCGRII